MIWWEALIAAMSVGIVMVGIAAVTVGAAWSWSSSMAMRRKPTVIAKACRECADPAEPNQLRCAHHRAVARSCRECADPAEPGELWCAHHRAIARRRAELRYEHFGCDRTGANDCRECARWARHERVWAEAGHTCTLFSPSEDCPECARRKIAAWKAAGHTEGCTPHPPTLDDLAGDCPQCDLVYAAAHHMVSAYQTAMAVCGHTDCPECSDGAFAVADAVWESVMARRRWDRDAATVAVEEALGELPRHRHQCFQ